MRCILIALKIILWLTIKFHHFIFQHDIEYLFTKEEYLKIFNLAFNKEYQEIKFTDLVTTIETILRQINKVIGKDRFNHYRPAYKLNQLGVDKTFFSATLDNFEKMFTEINKLF